MSEETQGAAQAVADDTVAALDTGAEDQASAQANEGDLGDDAAAATDEGEGANPKPRKSAQERIDEVTRARREAERQAEDARREAEFWRQQVTRTAPQPQQEPQAEAGEPDPNTYEHGELDARFIRDHATYHAKKAFREEQAQLEAQRQTQTAVQTFAQRLTEQYPDGEPEGVTNLRRLPTLSQVVQETIFDSEVGPKLADHLGKNPGELARISALPPIKQARELVKLEQKLASPPAPSPKIATDAPAPTPTLRGQGGRFTVAPDTNDFAAFEKQYGG
jgi:hypothetical protein